MRTDIIMPQMGESIAEGTVVRWLKQAGDRIERDEDLFEISTDKVESVIPSPVAGFLESVVVTAGQKVEVGTVVATIVDALSAGASAPASTPAPAPAALAAPASTAAAPPAPFSAPAPAPAPRGDLAAEDLRRTRSTPLVRRMAREHGFSLTELQGTGLSGRATRKDVEAFLAARASGSAPAPVAAPAPRATAPAPTAAATFHAPPVAIGDHDRVEPMSVMRQNIAEHMVMSRHVSAHCQTVHECDVTWVEQLRTKHKARYAERGVKLSFTVFLVKAVADALRTFPLMNASLSGNNIVFRGDVNVGVAVALEQGLIVPIVKNADELSVAGLGKAVDDLSTRARTRKLAPTDVQDGTFSISNAGVFGSLFGIPIISQPQVGILGVGGIKKRVMVMEDDAMAIRSVVTFCLTFDHRLIDGSIADGFMNKVKDVLMHFPENAM